MQFLLKTQQFVTLTFQHSGHRDTGRFRQDFSDFGIGNAVTQQLHGLAFCLCGRLKLFFQLRDFAILQFRHAPKVTYAARLLQRDLGLLQFRLDILGTRQRSLFRFPLFFQF
ncbi:hypothetical protein D3C73_783310 [compost metagenome]